LRYHARGWPVFPVKGKRPKGRWKRYQTTPPDESTLRQLFSGDDFDGVAVVLGSASNGLCCRDYDDLTSYQRWAESHPHLVNTLPTVETNRGRHLYFRGPSFFKKFDDGEYRGTSGQYTVLPPSRHPAGTIYRWLVHLPEGELPLVDPVEAGLCNREDRVGAESGDDGDHRENGANTANLPSWLVSASPSLSSAPSLLHAIEQAIKATLPSAKGQRNRCIFNFARHLRSIEELAGADFRALRQIVEEWHRRALPIIGTKPFVDTWADFLQAWKKVRIPAGKDAIGAALKRAVAKGPPAHVTKLYGEGPIVLLAAVCRELQLIAGEGEFFIDCRTAGRLIGVDHATAWRYLEVLCADGILAPGAKGCNVRRKASRFRFIDLES
jgi:hypothetical protein